MSNKGLFYENEFNLKGLFPTIKAQIKYHNTGFPYSGIFVFSGVQGSGKTYSAVNTVMKIKEAYPESLICSNLPLNGIDYIPYIGLKSFDYSNGENGIIYLIDEIQTLFSSLESQRMPVSTLTVWSQNRKNRRIIIGTSQRFQRIAKAIREQCTLNIYCERFLGFLCKQYFIDVTRLDDNGYLPPDAKDPMPHLYIPKVSVYNAYDTRYVIKRSEK